MVVKARGSSVNPALKDLIGILDATGPSLYALLTRDIDRDP
jgi:hypothetical protein